MSKARTLVIDEQEFTVWNGEIVSPGKFYGLAPHAVADYPNEMHSESFGDVEFRGFFWSVRKNGPTITSVSAFRYYSTDCYGFVREISAEEYESAQRQETEDAERENSIESLSDELRSCESEETGPCESCEVLTINGIRSHETGCPTFAHLVSLQKQIVALENGF